MEVPKRESMFSSKCIKYLTKNQSRSKAQTLMKALFGLGVLGLGSDFITPKILKRLSPKTFKMLNSFAKKRKLPRWDKVTKLWKTSIKTKKTKK